MGFMDKLKDMISVDDEYDDDDVAEVQETAAVTRAAAPQPVVKGTYENNPSTAAAKTIKANTQMVLFEPRSFGEAEEVGSRLKERRAVVVNLHKLDRDFAQRTIDFLTGVVYALDGNIQKIGQNVILCYPAEVGVEGSINLGAPDTQAEAPQE